MISNIRPTLEEIQMYGEPDAIPDFGAAFGPRVWEFFEKTACTRLNATQGQVLLCVWRYTQHLNTENNEPCPPSLIKASCHSNNKTISRAINSLVRANILLRRHGQRGSLEVNIDFDSWADPKQCAVEPVREGFVYLIEGIDGIYKIGRTNNPKVRLNEFKTCLPFPIALKHLIQTDDCIKLERDLHLQFSEKRMNGEWFRLTENDVISICQIKEGS